MSNKSDEYNQASYQPQSYQQQPNQPPPQVIYVERQGTTQETLRAIAAAKSYYGEAILTLLLYWLLLWIGGVIANIIFLNSASNTQKITGVAPEGKGCLTALLWVHVILPIVLGCLIGGLSMFLPSISIY